MQVNINMYCATIVNVKHLDLYITCAYDYTSDLIKYADMEINSLSNPMNSMKIQPRLIATTHPVLCSANQAIVELVA